MIVGTGPRLTLASPATSTASTKRSAKLEDVEREHIRTVLESTGWRVRGVGRGGRSARSSPDHARDQAGEARAQAFADLTK
jgi:hypothetical protein